MRIRSSNKNTPTDSDRAISDVLGFVLVFSLVITTVAIVSVGGISSLQDVRHAEQVNNAERAFDVLADNINELYTERAPSRGTEIDAAQATVYVGDPVTINVTGDTVTGAPFSVEREIRPVVYEPDDGNTRLVYAAGTIIRGQDESSVMIERPPFVMSDDNAIFTIINTTTDGTSSVGDTTVLVRAVREGSELAVERNDTVNRLWVNVTSDRAEAWAGYLDERSGVSCTTTGDEANCEITKSPDRLYVTVVEIEIAVGL